MARDREARRDDAPPQPPRPVPPAARADAAEAQGPLDAIQNVAFLGGDANVAAVEEVSEGVHRSSPLLVALESLKGLFASVLVAVSLYVSLVVDPDAAELMVDAPAFLMPLLVAGSALLVLAIVVVAAAISWRTRTWELTETEFVLRSGVFVRNERRVPYQRVHSVDLSASIFERILGLVSLKVDTGSDAANIVKAVKRTEAEALKRALFARKLVVSKREAASAGIDAPAAAETPRASVLDDPQADIDYEFNLPNDQHVRAALTDFGIGPVFLSAVLLLAGVGEYGEILLGAYLYDVAGEFVDWVISIFLGSEFNLVAYVLLSLLSTLVGVLVVLAVAWLVSAVMAYVRWGGFVLRRRGRRIEVSSGLLSRTTRAVDLGRVQSVSIDASPIRRALGLVQVAVRTVGSVSEQQGGDVASRERVVVHPCMPRAGAAAFVAEVLPEFAQVATAPVEDLALDALPPVALRRTLLRGGLWTLLCAGLLVPLFLLIFSVPENETSAFSLVLLVGLGCLAAFVLFGCAVMFVVRVLAFRMRRIGTAGSMFVMVNGGLGRHVTYVARPKVQSVTRRVSPLQARVKVATVVLRTACISAEPDPRMRDVAAATAERLMEWARPHYDNAEAAERALREAGLE